MGMHYHCIKAVEQKAYCLFIYLIGSNCASIYSAQGQAEPVAICSDSCAQPWCRLVQAANESNEKV